MLSNLTIVNPLSGITVGVTGEGSAPTFDGLDIRLTGPWDDLPLPNAHRSSVTWDVDTAGTLRQSTVEGLVTVALGSDVVMEGNRMNDACVVILGPDGGVTLRDNRVSSCPYGFAVHVYGHAIIEGNDLSVVDSEMAIGSTGRGSVVIVDSYPNVGNEVIVHDNVIHDGVIGVEVFPARVAEVTANRLHSLETAVTVSASEARLSDNVVSGNGTGIFVPERSPILEGNTVEGNEVGLRVGLSRPELVGNRICDNEINLLVTGTTQPATEGNEICPDEPA
jgi:parallel beta-helix repeat protein